MAANELLLGALADSLVFLAERNVALAIDWFPLGAVASIVFLGFLGNESVESGLACLGSIVFVDFKVSTVVAAVVNASVSDDESVNTGSPLDTRLVAADFEAFESESNAFLDTSADEFLVSKTLDWSN